MLETVVTVDLETTGLDPDRESIIEVAIVTIREGQIVDEWSSLVNPYRTIPDFIVGLTGITQNMVDDAPGIDALRGDIRRRLADRPLVGHNVSFDLGFLNAENLALGNQRLDTATLASVLLPKAGRFGLSSLANRLGLDGPQARNHRALDDARRTARLFLHLAGEAVELDLNTLMEIVQAGDLLSWPETIFFREALRQAGREAFRRSTQVKRLFRPPKPEGKPLVPVNIPEPLEVESIAGMLNPGGNFSRFFPNFEHRPQQVEMLEAVAEAFNEGRHLLVEAGTGTGKSIGYLLPALFWANQNGRRVVISTNTINLQDQLLEKDLPALERLLPFPIRAAVLKGKRNYLCTRLFRHMRHGGPNNADEMTLLARLLIWLPGSESGDVAEISLRGPGERLAWARLNAENDACTADRCAAEGCPLHLARRRAELAQVMVVNHALLLADVAAENRVLPEYLDLIVDEAHHLESAVTSGLSFRADRRYLESLLDEVNKPRAGLLADVSRRAAAALPAELSSVLDGHINQLREIGAQAANRLEELFTTLDYFLNQFIDRRSEYAEQIRITPAVRSQPEFDQVMISWDNVSKPLKLIVEGVGRVAGGLADVSDAFDVEDGEDLRLALLSLAGNLEETRVKVDELVSDPDPGTIYWAELFRSRISLHAAPLHVGQLVEEHIFNTKETVVLTSATLRTASARRSGDGGANFDYLRERLHAGHADELAVGSPFDYQASTLVYLPTDIPEPNQPGYQRYVEGAILDVAKALGGRTMALFTSYSQLQTTARAIEARLSSARLNLLAQLEGASRQQLLDQFRSENSRSVLLGTRSFWEGVDVPGRALQAVLIVKLPFDVPSDPIFAARSETYDNAFFEFSLPETVLRFRQGFGRLIRRQDDQGVVVVLDKRVLTRRYGQLFLEALPECTILRQRVGRLGELTLRWLNRERAGR